MPRLRFLKEQCILKNIADTRARTSEVQFKQAHLVQENKKMLKGMMKPSRKDLGMDENTLNKTGIDWSLLI